MSFNKRIKNISQKVNLFWLVYLCRQLALLALLIFWRGFELLTSVILFQLKVLSCVYLVWLVSEKQILSSLVYYKYFYFLAAFKILSFNHLILTYMYIDHLKFIPLIIEFLGCVGQYFSSYLGGFQPIFLQCSFLTLCVSPSPRISHYLYVGIFNSVLNVSESLHFHPLPLSYFVS